MTFAFVAADKILNNLKNVTFKNTYRGISLTNTERIPLTPGPAPSSSISNVIGRQCIVVVSVQTSEAGEGGRGGGATGGL